MPATTLTTLFCNDEDIARRVSGDFVTLCPKGQTSKVADGVIAAGAWLLTSASVAWTTFGVAAGQVVSLEATGKFKGDLFAVDSVSSSGATLRRIGQPSGVGFPPGGPAGVTSITIVFPSLYAQIVDSTYDLMRRFGVDPNIAGRTPADFYDIHETCQACVLDVLHKQYFAMARSAGNTTEDDFVAKSKAYGLELDDVLGRLVVHWRTASGWGINASEPSTSRFNTRISR